MANPAYLTDQNVRYNSVLDPSILIATTGTGVSKVLTLIVWSLLSSVDQTLFTAFLTAINGGATTTVAAYAGYQIVDFNGAIVGTNACGLLNGETYNANIIIDGTNYPVSFTSTGANIYNDIITAISTAIGAAGTAAIVNGDIKITSATTGTTSTVLIDRIDSTLSETINGKGYTVLSQTGATYVDNPLFRNMTGFKTYQTPINGATDLLSAMQANYVPMSTSLNYSNDYADGETYYNLFRGAIQNVTVKPSFATMGAGGSGFSATATAWYDPAGGTAYAWYYLISDLAA